MAHTLRLLPSSPYPSESFICNLCREQGCGPVYHCSSGCDYDLHVACAAMTTEHTHFAHPHHLLRRTPCISNSRICDICGSPMRSWSFRCNPCGFNMHSLCARAPRFIMHPHHSHPLELLKLPSISGTIQCSGCQTLVSGCYYSCHSCRFHLHQACATSANKVKHVRHQAHILEMDYSLRQDEERVTICSDCVEPIEGWHFTCAMCDFNLHPLCADILHELPHGNAAPQESNTATTSVDTHAARTAVNSVSTRTIPHDSPHVDVPNSLDFDAVKRVLRYAEEMMKANLSVQSTEGNSVDPQDGLLDHCPTCLEGFDSTNPRKLTQCGHSFHMACILEWLERSDNCPVCRADLIHAG